MGQGEQQLGAERPFLGGLARAFEEETWPQAAAHAPLYPSVMGGPWRALSQLMPLPPFFDAGVSVTLTCGRKFDSFKS